MIHTIWRYSLIIFFGLILAACASPDKNLSAPSDTFMRSGRFAINYQSSLQKPYAAQGGFQWLDSGTSLTINLTNPMGSTVASIKINQRQSILTYADGKTQSADSPDELLAKVWGHSAPVAGLRYWIRGSLYPDATATNIERDGDQLNSFKQLGWQVKLSDYDSLGPRKISLLRTDAQSRLILKFMIS